jgi:hypothetical protein
MISEKCNKTISIKGKHINNVIPSVLVYLIIVNWNFTEFVLKTA